MEEHLYKLMFGLLGISILATAGAIIDVQLLKKDVLSSNEKIEEIHINTVWLKERWIEKYGRN